MKFFIQNIDNREIYFNFDHFIDKCFEYFYVIVLLNENNTVYDYQIFNGLYDENTYNDKRSLEEFLEVHLSSILEAHRGLVTISSLNLL